LISVLTGASFAVFYVAVGLPVARFADRGNRRNIVATSVLVWSAMTAACGLAWNYASLIVARAGTGAGEGALSPSAQSMLADYFPKERLPAALGVFSMGIYVGNGLALVLGGAVTAAATTLGVIHVGLLGDVKPWQLVFFAAGAPGLALAAFLFAIREPARRGSGASGAAVSMRELWLAFLNHRTAYLTLAGAFALLVMHGHGSGTWIPTFFIRKFGWEPGRIGAAYGTVVLLFGTSGALLGGFFTNALRRRRIAEANVLTCLAGCALATPFAVLFPLAPTPEVSLALLAGMNFFAGVPFAGGYAAIQELTPNRMRAQVVAALLFLVNLVGGGLGPTVIAVFTDFLFHDTRALPNALALSAALTLPVAVALLALLLRFNAAESASNLKRVST
jgi:MFS family permease